MAPPNTRAQANWAVERATALPEVWALVAKHRGVLGARRLMRMCKAARAGGLEYLRTLPWLVVCGGEGDDDGFVSDALRLDLATMRWEPMPAVVTARDGHACCLVRGALVVLGGSTGEDEPLTSSSVVMVKESNIAAGKVLLLGGVDATGPVPTVQLVDLATGACVPQNNLLHQRFLGAVGQLPDGRIVCASGVGAASLAEVWGPPVHGAPDAAWSWRELPAMSAGRWGCRGFVMSDGRFAVLGGSSNNHDPTSSCEALVIDDGDVHWEPL
jgi:hypothetical protein